ncbi:uncharacterized protein LOC134195221 [Corticium candelabrum]|uniref:uncharacterized protein LOC134195221 n=1 Tax=Corticium candelabrum TaxID=121492 RepID=UPI002E26C4CD|nr:uncharacterized protein LOC134195221 [Corticium candelabrum]
MLLFLVVVVVAVVVVAAPAVVVVAAAAVVVVAAAAVTATYPWLEGLQLLAEHVPGVQYLAVAAMTSIYSKVPKVHFCSHHPALVEMLLNLMTEQQNRLLKLDDLKCYTEHSLGCLCSQNQQHDHQQQQPLHYLALLSEGIPGIYLYHD